MKYKTAYKKFKAIQEVGSAVSVPWEVSRILGGKKINIFGDQIALSPSGDYASLEEARNAVAYYVEQLGGSVTWK